MKNILQIMDYGAPYRGNFIASLESLEAGWCDNGITAYLLPEKSRSLNWVKEFIRSGKRVYFIDNSFYSRKVKWSNLTKLTTILSQENIKIINTHFIAHNYSLFLFSKFINNNIPIIATLHNNYEPKGRLAALNSWVIRNTISHCIGVGEFVSHTAKKAGINPSKVSTIRNAIQFKRLDSFENCDSLRKLKPVVFMLGHPWHRKGVDIVSKAIAELNKHTTKTVTLAITMAGGESEIRHGIEKVLGSVPTWIIFLKPREDLATYYNNSDVFISAGRDEGLTYAAIEAAYCSTMVACSNISGNPLDVPNLFVYETEDHLALKAGIETLLALTNQQRNVAKLVQQEYILKHYDLGSWVKRTMRVYIEILRQVG